MLACYLSEINSFLIYYNINIVILIFVFINMTVFKEALQVYSDICMRKKKVMALTTYDEFN